MVKVVLPCINGAWIALLIHGFSPINARLLLTCCTAFYSIMWVYSKWNEFALNDGDRQKRSQTSERRIRLNEMKWNHKTDEVQEYSSSIFHVFQFYFDRLHCGAPEWTRILHDWPHKFSNKLFLWPARDRTSRKHTYIVMTPLNPTLI